MLCTLELWKELIQTPFSNLPRTVVFNLRCAYLGGAQNHFSEYAKISYSNQNETKEPLEP
jgi:hypothetical protein